LVIRRLLDRFVRSLEASRPAEARILVRQEVIPEANGRHISVDSNEAWFVVGLDPRLQSRELGRGEYEYFRVPTALAWEPSLGYLIVTRPDQRASGYAPVPCAAGHQYFFAVDRPRTDAEQTSLLLDIFDQPQQVFDEYGHRINGVRLDVHDLAVALAGMLDSRLEAVGVPWAPDDESLN
jgi:hypothetical protein